MNRLVIRISVVSLGAAIAFSPCAFAKRHKKQKDYNISENALKNVKSEQPDKILYDKAMKAMKKGHFDVARLDLQTLLNTYSESQYAMRAKLAIGDTWFKEGGSAALAQAEQEYKDFITFFPNSPEAAEAQMKVGDIYFMQMEKPDRDPQNALNAEREYRTMLEQFPDSPLIPRAKQRLRDVQEVLAQRQYEIGEYYFSQQNWAAAIARLQTVADTYPLFSKSDETLISIGDAYANEAAFVARYRIPEKAKSELVKYYDDQAAAAWDRVCTHYPLSPHVEDAKDRLIAMGRPIPTPTAAELAESQAEADSRANEKLGLRALSFLSQRPDTSSAARVGNPSLTTPPPVIPKDLNEQAKTAFLDAMRGKPIPEMGLPGQPAPGQTQAASPASTPAEESGGAVQTLQFGSVPTAQSSPAGSSVNVQVTGGNPGGGATQDTGSAPGNPPTSEPLAAPVGPTNNQALPPIDKPAAAPPQVNEVPAGASQQMPKPPLVGKKGKNPKPKFFKKKESSSKHKGKKGLHKLNPF